MSEVFTVKGKLSLDADEFHEGVDEAVKEGKKLADNVDESSKQVKGSLTDAFSVMKGNMMSKALSAAFDFLVDVGKEAIQTASDLQEVQNVVDVTFGDSAAAIESWATTAQTQFGLTELQAKQYTSTMGAMLKSMGIGEGEVYGMSTAMAGLAADMASFYNLDFDEAFSKIRAGISGETEPLKQLGINMSVANLEAYALANGIDKAYNSMTQAEQATLRYNYLMSVTADAQGDFARTSDSLANSWRTFKTSMSSIVASIGEVVLPVVNDAINALGDMIASFGDLPKSLEKIDKSYNDNAATIELNQLHAEALIDTLDALSQKNELNAVETAQWNSAVQQLTAIYPSLQGMIGSTTGELNTSIATIKAETEALKESAMEKARIAALEAKREAWYATAAKVADAELEARMSQRVLESFPAKIEGIKTEIEAMAALADATALELGFLNAQDAMSSGVRDERIASVEEYVRKANDLRGELEAVQAEEIDVQNETAKLKEKHEELNKQLTAETEKLQEWEAILDELTGASGEAAEGANNYNTSVIGTTEAQQRAAESAEELKDKLEKLQKEEKELKQLLDDIEQYKASNLSNIAKSVEGLYGTFEKADRVRRTSFRKMTQGVESQIEQSNRWLEAWRELQSMGASEELLTNFEYSPEGIAQMEALIKEGPEGVAKLQAMLAEAEAKRAEITGELYENSLAADEDFQSMVAQADALYAALAEGMGEIQAAVDALELNIEAEDGASSVIKEVKEGLAELDGTEAITYVRTLRYNGGVDGSHATGLNRVPFDGYIARLHEDEAVLNKREANEWRKGKNGNGGQVVNVTQNIQAVPMTPSELAAQTKHALGMMRFSV